MGNIEEYREKIDKIDKELVSLFEARMELVSKVSDYKKENNLPVLNSKRESKVIEKNIKHLKNKDLNIYLKDLFISIMNISKEYQENKRRNKGGFQ